MSGNARFRAGPPPVSVVHRPADPDGVVKVTCAGDPATSGYRCAYRGTIEQAIACLEKCVTELWRLKVAGEEPEITP